MGDLARLDILNPYLYFFFAIGMSVVIHAIHAVLSALQLWDEHGRLENYWKWVNFIFWGGMFFKPRPFLYPAVSPNYFYPFLIGTFEILIYPALISTNSYLAIGAWVSIKTVSQWGRWQQARATFNMFLIGNLLTLVVGYFLGRWFIEFPATLAG